MNNKLNLVAEPFVFNPESDETPELFDSEIFGEEGEGEFARKRRKQVRPSGLRVRPVKPRRPLIGTFRPPKPRLPLFRPRAPGIVIRPPVVDREPPYEPPVDTPPERTPPDSSSPTNGPPESAPATREGSEYVRWVQSSLNRILGIQLPLDGIMGPETRSAIRSFQEQKGLPVDGIVGPPTKKALIEASKGQPSEPSVARGDQSSKTEEYEAFDTEQIDTEFGEEVGLFEELDEEQQPDLFLEFDDETELFDSELEEEILTPNFRLSEFSSKGTTPRTPVPPEYLPNVRRLAQNLQVLRDHTGQSITVTSGYRTPRHNAAVRGATNSQHLIAKASDITVSGLTPAEVYCTIEELIRRGRMEQGGLGIYNTFVHYDVRGSRARWTGSGARRPDCRPTGELYAPPIESRAYTEFDNILEYDVIVPSEVVYEVEAGQEYGPRWRSRRPPGLPEYARLTSKQGAALPYIEKIARAQGIGEVFVTTVRHLAETESGGMFARSANTFDARPKGQRPAGKNLITAWGAFQFNRGAWQSLPGVARSEFPWDSTPYDELNRPILNYMKLFSNIVKAGGAEIDAARGIRLWHRTPAGYARYLSRGKKNGFLRAWRQVDSSHRNIVDRHLRSAGIIV